MTKTEIESLATDLGLTMTAEFIPWSKSRNADEKHPSLNWKVTLAHKGKDFLTTEYMAGCGHCPSYKQGLMSVDEDAAIKNECERGQTRLGKKIQPILADVLHSLATDADAIDHKDFEDWCETYAADPDSRKAEATYRACLDIALKLRNALGDDGLKQLREAVQDY